MCYLLSQKSSEEFEDLDGLSSSISILNSSSWTFWGLEVALFRDFILPPAPLIDNEVKII